MSINALGFLGLYTLGLVLALARHPIFGLYAYLWAFYNWPGIAWWGADLPDVRWSLIAAAVTLMATVRMPSSALQPPWHANWGARLLIIYVLWMWIQNLWAVNGSYHLEGCILYTKYIVLFYVIYRIVADERTFERFAWGHVVGCFIFGWLAYRSGIDGRLEGIGGPGVTDSNTLGMHLTTGLAFAGYMFLGLRGTKRWLAFATIPFITNGIILTASRGAFMGMLAAGLVALQQAPKAYKRLVYGAIALGIVLFSILAHDLFWERMATIRVGDEENMEASARSRIDLIRYGWHMAQDYPLGSGFRGHEVLSPHYIPEADLTNGRRSAHNTFIAALVEQGYPGALVFVALVAWGACVLIRLKALDKFGLSTSLALYRAALSSAFMAYFVSGQFSNFLRAEVGIWLLTLLAVLADLCYTSMHKEALQRACIGNTESFDGYTSHPGLPRALVAQRRVIARQGDQHAGAVEVSQPN